VGGRPVGKKKGRETDEGGKGEISKIKMTDWDDGGGPPLGVLPKKRGNCAKGKVTGVKRRGTRLECAHHP